MKTETGRPNMFEKSEAVEKRENLSQLPPRITLRVHELHRLIQGDLRKISEENGIPAGYRGVLLHLAHHNGCGQGTLAKYVGIKPSSVSVTLEKMERDGYIKRVKDDQDQRAMKVFLTEKGWQIDKKNRKQIDEIEALVASTLQEEERVQLLYLIDKLIKEYCAVKGMVYPPKPPFEEKDSSVNEN